ncbi:MAG TPA: hypothetical protein VFI58_11830 [Xanthobacteraceae bacterium]|nr:hypothetical protein [Xanthobacteraceae bacterium]
MLGNFAEFCREFEQRLPRVDLRGLIGEPQAFFGMLAAFFRRRHIGGPRGQRPLDGIVPPFCGPRDMQMTVSGSILDDPKHWLERAEEARSIADQLSDPDSRRMMLRIAEDYERWFCRCRERVRSRPAASSSPSRQTAPIIGRAPIRIGCRQRRSI